MFFKLLGVQLKLRDETSYIPISFTFRFIRVPEQNVINYNCSFSSRFVQFHPFHETASPSRSSGSRNCSSRDVCLIYIRRRAFLYFYAAQFAYTALHMKCSRGKWEIPGCGKGEKGEKERGKTSARLNFPASDLARFLIGRFERNEITKAECRCVYLHFVESF